MNNRIKIYILSLFVCGITSCAKFLEEDNKGGTSNEEFYKTEAGYSSIVTAAYSSLRTTFGATSPLLQLSGTDMYQMNRGQDNRALMEYSQLFADNADVLDFYTNCYNAIQNINVGIYYNDVVDVDEASKVRWLAELRFLRAFYHFALIEQFGGIVINSEATLDGSRMNLPRSSLADSYDFVISEMEAVVGDLGNDRTKANQAAANHYLAKAYLTRGWDLQQTQDFEKAKEYAAEVINNFQISIPFEELWSPTNDMNSEVLFAVQYDISSIADIDQGNNQQSLFGPYLGGAELNHKYMSSTFVPSWSLHNFYGANDARYEATFMLTIYDQYFDYYDNNKDKSEILIRAAYPRVWGREYTSSDSIAWAGQHVGQLPSNLRFYPFRYDEEAYRVAYQTDMSSPVIKKFDSPSTRTVFDPFASVRDIVLARAAESYFLYAEACIGLQDYQGATEKIQQVLNRPGNAKDGGTLSVSENLASATDQSSALDGYLIESAKEFAGEYLRWAELRRTDKLKDFCAKYNYDIKKIGVDNAFRGLDGQDKIYRPIPQSAIDINEANIEQNPGYQ